MIQFRVARTEDDVNEVMQVVRGVYTRIGYIDTACPVDLRPHTYVGRDDAVSIIAAIGAPLSTIGTISVVMDGPEGLPIDIVYPAEMEKLRRDGTQSVEVRRFAIETTRIEEYNAKTPEEHIAELDVSTGLLGISVQYALYKNCDAVCFMIKKEHRSLYESLGCVQIGDERPCPAISGRPVIAYKLDLHQQKNGQVPQNFLYKKIMNLKLPTDFFSRELAECIALS